MSGVTQEMLRTIAAMLDHPSVYMGGPSQRNMRRAEQIIAAVAPIIAAQERERALAIAQSEHSDAAQDIDMATQGGDEMGRLQSEGAAHAAARIAAAIRALGDAT